MLVPNSWRAFLWSKFQALKLKAVPKVAIPKSPKEAFETGFRYGLRTGFGEGLVDGIELGLDTSIVLIEQTLNKPTSNEPTQL